MTNEINTTKLTVLRDPIKRIISHFLFEAKRILKESKIKENNQNYINVTRQLLSKSTIATSIITSQVRVFSNGYNLEEAKDNLSMLDEVYLLDNITPVYRNHFPKSIYVELIKGDYREKNNQKDDSLKRYIRDEMFKYKHYRNLLTIERAFYDYANQIAIK